MTSKEERLERRRNLIVYDWSEPPPHLPQGCPWVLPIAAAALRGSGICVERMHAFTGISSMESESVYGCFRFSAMVVAQSLSAAKALDNDYFMRLCVDIQDRVLDLLKLELQPGDDSPQLSPRASASSKDSTEIQPHAAGDALNPQAAGGNSSMPRSAGGLVTMLGWDPMELLGRWKELLLLHARLFHDPLGQPLAASLGGRSLPGATLCALEYLDALLEFMGQPSGKHNGRTNKAIDRLKRWALWLITDQFLSHAEHSDVSSTTLFGILAHSYGKFLAAGGASSVWLGDDGGVIKGVLIALSAKLLRGSKVLADIPDDQKPKTTLVKLWDRVGGLYEATGFDLKRHRRDQWALASLIGEDMEFLTAELLLQQGGADADEGVSISPARYLAGLTRDVLWGRRLLPVWLKDVASLLLGTQPATRRAELQRRLRERGQEGTTRGWRQPPDGPSGASAGLWECYHAAGDMLWELYQAREDRKAQGCSTPADERVDWARVLRVVKRIAAGTLDLPPSMEAAAAQVSAMAEAEAVGRLLQLRAWDAIDVNMLAGTCRRLPHEAARLIHTLELEPVEMSNCVVPSALGPGFYGVAVVGDLPQVTLLLWLLITMWAILRSVAVALVPFRPPKNQTRIQCHRVPLAYAGAMPTEMLHALVSSPQVNGELFATPVMRAVITWRWRAFARYFMMLQFVEHLIYMVTFLVYALSLSYPSTLAGVVGEAATTLAPTAACALPPTGLQRALLIALSVLTLTCVTQEVRQLTFAGLYGWIRQPWNLMEFSSSTLVTSIIALHFSCNTQAEWLRALASVEVILLFARLLYFAMAVDRLGSFFRMVIEVFRDLSLFFVFLGVLFVGWGLALCVMQGQNVTVIDTYQQLWLLQDANAGSSGLNHLWRVFMSLYMILVTIILLNILIAIINDSYERINDAEAHEALRTRAMLVVEAESVLPRWLAKRTLAKLARSDLYVITLESARASATAAAAPRTATGAGADAPNPAPAGSAPAGSGGSAGPLVDPLGPPTNWTGRTGETKRHVSRVGEQLQAALRRELAEQQKAMAEQQEAMRRDQAEFVASVLRELRAVRGLPASPVGRLGPPKATPQGDTAAVAAVAAPEGVGRNGVRAEPRLSPGPAGETAGRVADGTAAEKEAEAQGGAAVAAAQGSLPTLKATPQQGAAAAAPEGPGRSGARGAVAAAPEGRNGVKAADPLLSPGPAGKTPRRVPAADAGAAAEGEAEAQGGAAVAAALRELEARQAAALREAEARQAAALGAMEARLEAAMARMLGAGRQAQGGTGA
ncbi:hypothetical protein HYH03_006403 [Edaphochlamys debaryana]|uniref:Ion transport domain-containing protein n=1 Tax=Edaphochlamys debaryana TaxID=47281 RepID=A0A835Y668_9CHLO|nr:hypothetical protein HYH03_006403 [Edaphochlamys debaryana]|eukprot:KAG2495458.1 hypothetical protein HYH03_006403 [Edaphochlamys debaryana]